MSDRNILHLEPSFRAIYLQWMNKCIEQGINAHAIVTWRSAAEQDIAKQEGLSNAAAGQSPHNHCDAEGEPCSLAFDYGIFENDGSYVSDGTDPRYRQAGEIGMQLGLVWGGIWKHPDFDHLEVADWKSLT